MRKLKTILGTLAILLIITVVSIPAAALACNPDIASTNPNSISLTAVVGTTVNTSTQILITRAGSDHLHSGDSVTFNNVASGSGSTNLPSGYSVSSVSGTIPSPWNTNGTIYTVGTSSISFTAPATAGTYNYRVKWTETHNYYGLNDDNVKLNICLTVIAAPVLTSITVTPPSTTILVGATYQYTAIAHYSDSSTLDVTATASWTVGGGNTISGGLVTGITVGTDFPVTASWGGHDGNALVTVTHGDLLSITVDPLSATIPVGATQPYTATAHYQDGYTLDVTTLAAWSVSGGGTIGLNTGIFSATTVGGPFPVTATWSSLSGTAEVTVIAHGDLVSITVDPPSATLPVGATQQYTATGHDGYGNSWDITTTATWSVGGGGTIGLNTGLFTGTTVGGPFTVTATQDSISGTAEVIVIAHGDLLSIIVDPPSATLPVGATQQYIATGYDTYGNYWDITTIVDWSVGGGGTIGLNTGLFNATTVGGPFPVTATLGLISGTASVTVIAHGELVSITVNPPSATINVGATQQYTATGHDAYGNSWDITDIVTWTVSGGGDIGPNTGLFDATTVGDSFTVTATWGLITGSVTGTALVNVVTETTPTTTPTTTTTETTTTTTTTTETIPTETNTIGPPVTETNNWWLWTVIGIVAFILILLFLLFFFKWQKVLVFVKELPATAIGKVSDMITVQVRYQNGDAYDVKKDEKVFLNTKSATGKFDVSASGAFDGSLKNVVIAKDKNSVSFYYKDSKGGEYNIIAKKTNMLPWKRGALKVNIK